MENVNENQIVDFLVKEGINVDTHKMLITVELIEQDKETRDNIIHLSKRFNYGIVDNKIRLVSYERNNFKFNL